MHGEFALFTIASLLLMLPGAAYSANSTQITQMLISQAYQQISCRTNFTVSFIGSIVSTIPSLSNTLNPDATALQQDTLWMRGLANAGNDTAFRSYVAQTYDPELNLIRKDVARGLQGVNRTRNQTSTIREAYNASKSELDDCELSALKSYAGSKVLLYNSALEYFNGRIANLSAMGLNTSALTQLMHSANSQIVAPLQTAITGAANVTQVRSALAEYCLYDGCIDGTNFHLQAHFKLVGLQLVVNRLDTSAITDTTALERAESKLNGDSVLLSGIGTSSYTAGQAAQLLDDFKLIIALLRSAFRH